MCVWWDVGKSYKKYLLIFFSENLFEYFSDNNCVLMPKKTNKKKNQRYNVARKVKSS